MSPATTRPFGVTLVAVFLFITGILSIMGGILGFIGSSNGASETLEGVTLDGTGIAVLSGFFVVVGVLNMIFAFGILRGSRVARAIITVLQLITIISGVVALVTSGAQLWHGIYNLLLPILIVVLLWAGARTREFFASR
ncbi:hypothetical protein GCM10027421_04500 [Microbacterium shaanxiense]